MKSNRFIVQVIIHVAGWLCFMMLPFVFFSRPKDSSFIPEQYLSTYFLLINFLYISFYYFNSYYLIPKLLPNRRLVIYTLINIGIMIFFGMFPRLYRHLSYDLKILPPNPMLPNRPHHSIPALLSGGSIAIYLLLFTLSTGINVVSQWFEFEKRNKEIENDKLNTELSFLKSQINPHFLFNTLNNIYSLAASQSEKTSEAVLKLSSIMRYVLTEVKNDFVPLEKEIQFITHYIELQKLRLSEKSSITFKISGEPSGKQVSPLLFLPFVENAFKYGISTRDSSPVTIILEVTDEDLVFEVKNNKHGHFIQKPETTGIGILNAKRRLELLYHNNYSLDIQEDAKTYQVTLKIHLS